MSKVRAIPLPRRGFDVARMGFGLRTALASCLALAVAWLMGLEHPQWAAMTVWAVSQPVRGMLLEKSLFRALGTLIGTLFGVVLVVVAGDNLPLLVLSLSLWIGLCVGIGNLLSGLVSYGALLSVIRATMVALLMPAACRAVFALGSDASYRDRRAGRPAGGPDLPPPMPKRSCCARVRPPPATCVPWRLPLPGYRNPRRQGASFWTHCQCRAAVRYQAAGSVRSHRSVRALRALVQAQVGAATGYAAPAI